MEALSEELFTSVCTLIGVILTVYFGNAKTLYRIEQLEKKQDRFNNVIERTYILEEKAKETDRRLNNLEE